MFITDPENDWLWYCAGDVCHGALCSRLGATQQTQNIWITFVQRRPSVLDAGPTLYKCYTNVLCLLGTDISRDNEWLWIIWGVYKRNSNRSARHAEFKNTNRSVECGKIRRMGNRVINAGSAIMVIGWYYLLSYKLTSHCPNDGMMSIGLAQHKNNPRWTPRPCWLMTPWMAQPCFPT